MTTKPNRPEALYSLGDLVSPTGSRPRLSLSTEAFDSANYGRRATDSELEHALAAAPRAFVTEGNPLTVPGTADALAALDTAEEARDTVADAVEDAKRVRANDLADLADRRAAEEYLATKPLQAATVAHKAALRHAARTVFDVPPAMLAARESAYVNAWEAAHEAAREALSALKVAVNVRDVSAAVVHVVRARDHEAAETAKAAQAAGRNEVYKGKPYTVPGEATNWRPGGNGMWEVTSYVQAGWSVPDAA